MMVAKHMLCKGENLETSTQTFKMSIKNLIMTCMFW